METLYLEIFSEVDNNHCCKVPIESLIVAFAYKYCNEEKLSLILKLNTNVYNNHFDLCLSGMPYEIYQNEKLPNPANFCKLPVIVSNGGTTCIAGLCAVTRQIFKASDDLADLLGFKQNCLYACAEASLWTRFCEIDVPQTTINMFQSKNPDVPLDLLRYEGHLAQPVRIHNIQKKKQDIIKASGGTTPSIPDARLQMTAELNHLYSEGPSVSIADVILFPCFHLILKLSNPSLKKMIPLVIEWHQRMLELREVGQAISIFALSYNSLVIPVIDCTLLNVPQESLYKSDPKRYKPRHRIFTKQADIEESLKIVEPVELKMLSNVSFGGHTMFEWADLPLDAHPQGGGSGALPEERAARKAEQLKAMAKAVLTVAQDGDIIVDFCAGCGHLGIVLACFLKNCTIVLLENKEESMNRARERVEKLQLSNVLFCQTNVDYFTGHFTLGVSLHACGVATDLVLEACISRGAVFVSCPCCYGSVQTNHVIQYPRSEEFKSLPITERQYLVLGHAADQTHDVQNEKTKQGLKCMNIIDGDRCLRAKSLGYKVSLSKLDPPSCTPKNNLLIGLPYNRS